MKGNHTRPFDPVQQKCDVTGAADNLRVLANDVRIHVRNQMTAAVAAASAEDGMDVRASEHLKKFSEAAFAWTGEIAIRRDDVGPEVRLEPETLQFPASFPKQVQFDVAGGSDDTNGVASPQRRRFNVTIHG